MYQLKSEDFYPIVELPLVIQKHLEGFCYEYNQPKPPIPVDVFKDTQPTSTFWFILGYLGSLLVGQGSEGFAAFIAVVSTLFAIVEISGNRNRQESYRKDLERFYEAKRNYEKQLKNYKSAQEVVAKEKRRLENPVYAEKKRLEKVNECLACSTIPSITEINIKKGMSEGFFYTFLQKQFPEKIFTNIRFKHYKKYQLTPDIVYWDKELNLLIDIEIDEPYELSTGERKVIHHLTEPADGSIGYLEDVDNWRNAVFNDYGWIVIRFAEIQVLTNPVLCYELIAATIECILKGNSAKQKLLSCHEELKVRRWGQLDAEAFRRLNFRESYLIKNGFSVSVKAPIENPSTILKAACEAITIKGTKSIAVALDATAKYEPKPIQGTGKRTLKELLAELSGITSEEIVINTKAKYTPKAIQTSGVKLSVKELLAKLDGMGA